MKASFPSPDTMFLLRFESAVRKRFVKDNPMLENVEVHCEACLQKIPRYIGPKNGILCSVCLATMNCCTRIMPLAITRSSIQEDGAYLPARSH